MIKEGKIGVGEAVWLCATAIAAKVFFTSPATVTKIVGTAGWYMTLISAATALLGFLFVLKLLQRFPNQDLGQIFNQALGPLFGFLASGILGFYLLFVAITGLAEFSEVIRVYVFPLSPGWYIVGPAAFTILLLARLGLEAIAKLSRLLAFPMLFGFLLVFLLATKNYRISNIYPILGNGLANTVKVGIVRSSAYGEITILAIFARSFQGFDHLRKEGLRAILLSAALIGSSILAFTLTFPYYIGREVTAPMYELASLIDHGLFLQRVEPIFLFIWIITTVIATATVFYSFIWLFCHMFKIPDKNPIVLAGAVLLLASSLMHKDIMDVVIGGVEVARKCGSLVFFGLPFLTLIVALIRRIKGGQNV